jgi:hypothetical protein
VPMGKRFRESNKSTCVDSTTQGFIKCRRIVQGEQNFNGFTALRPQLPSQFPEVLGGSQASLRFILEIESKSVRGLWYC